MKYCTQARYPYRQDWGSSKMITVYSYNELDVKRFIISGYLFRYLSEQRYESLLFLTKYSSEDLFVWYLIIYLKFNQVYKT